VMKCASTPWTAVSIQGLHATPMSRPLWYTAQEVNHLLHCIMSESPTHWPAISICVLP